MIKKNDSVDTGKLFGIMKVFEVRANENRVDMEKGSTSLSVDLDKIETVAEGVYVYNPKKVMEEKKYGHDTPMSNLTEANELDLAGVLEIMLTSHKSYTDNEGIYLDSLTDPNHKGKDVSISIKEVEEWIKRLNGTA